MIRVSKLALGPFYMLNKSLVCVPREAVQNEESAGESVKSQRESKDDNYMGRRGSERDRLRDRHAATELREMLGRAVEVPVDSHIRDTVTANAAKAKHPGGILPPCVAWHAHVAELLAVRVQRRQQRGNGACRER